MKHVLQGQQDGELTEKGVQQATHLANRLKTVEFDFIYCSDLGRCKDTLNAILTYHNRPEVQYDRLLREKAAGEHEGKPIGCTEYEARARGIPFRAYKGEGGESWIDVNVRAEAFLKQLCDRHLSESAVSRPLKILVVTHGGWLMEMRNVLRTWSRAQIYYANTSRNTALYILLFTRPAPDRLHCSFLLTNDASHLEP